MNEKKQKIDPYNNKFLLDYLAAIQNSHSYMDLLDTGAFDKENVLLTPTNNRLYVTPNFSSSYIDPQSKVEEWEDLIDFDTLLDGNHKKLFILGDPGIGKTTLSNRISVIFSKLENEKFIKKHQYLIPFPITLRDLDYAKIENWDDLLKQYFTQSKFKKLKIDNKIIIEVFENGQAFVLLDGLDEITDEKLRQKLANIIRKAIYSYTDGYWWITSRIVGFNQEKFWNIDDYDLLRYRVSKKGEKNISHNFTVEEFDMLINKLKYSKLTPSVNLVDLNEEEHKALRKDIAINIERNGFYPEFKEVYITPFNNIQIKSFMKLWYNLYEPDQSKRENNAQAFYSNLSSHKDIFHLARIPNLLTMMALYYRVNKKFPDGRYELYKKISEQYLQIIYDKRGISRNQALSLDEEKKCLSALAIRMQENRGEDEKANLSISEKEAKEVFINKLKELRKTESKEVQTSVQQYFKSLQKTSAVLIPRGKEVYGFLHLSYQEYFAANALKEEFDQVTRRWAKEETENQYWEKLKKYASQGNKWTETFVLYFESFMAKWEAKIQECRYAFEKIFDWDKETGRVKQFSLAFNILFDESISSTDWKEINRTAPLFSQDEHLSIMNFGFINSFWSHKNKIFEWGENLGLYIILKNSDKIPTNNNYYWVEAKGYTNLNEIKKLRECRHLTLTDAKIQDVKELGKLTKLQWLELNNNKIKEIEALKELKQLRTLVLSNNQIKKIEALKELKQLEGLELNNNKIKEIEALKELKQLRTLVLNNNKIKEIEALKELKQLHTLVLSNNQIKEIKALEELKQLFWLDLNNNQIKEIEVLKELKRLAFLMLDNNQFKEIEALKDLKQLRWLELNNNQIKEIEALTDLEQLSQLELNNNQIKKIEALTDLEQLSQLELNNNQIKNIEVLKELKNLRNLDLRNNPIKDKKALNGLDCKIIW